MNDMYSPYIHEVRDAFGRLRFCVGHYDAQHQQWFWPVYRNPRHDVGASEMIATSVPTIVPRGFSFTTRRKAILRARKIYRIIEKRTR